MSTYRDALRFFEQHRNYMEDSVHAGIEANQKKFFRLRVTDGEGKPLSGVKVQVKQLKSAFRFGCACLMLGCFDSEEENKRYEEQFAGLFNLVTLPIYWNTLEPLPGQPRFAKDSTYIYRRPPVELCLDFCEKYGMTPKAHCLVYDQFTPDWVPNRVSDIKRLYEKRFAELAERYADRIPMWEVINETLCWGKTVLAEQPDMVEWAFRLAEKYFPQNELIINETNGLWARFHYNRSAYYMQIERALAKGARIDAVGLQWHLMMNPETLLSDDTPAYLNPYFFGKVSDLYNTFRRPLQITEVTIPAYSEGKEDESVQAELLEHLYSLWFAAPNMEAIIYWNLVDGYAWRAEKGDFSAGENRWRGGLVRYDGTRKKAYYTLQRLLNTWRTEEKTLETDRDGLCSFKGFFGDYAVTAQDAEGRTLQTRLSFAKDSADSARLIL